MKETKPISNTDSPGIPWILLTLGALFFWIVLGFAPAFIFNVICDWGLIDQESLQYIGQIGDNFGAANALFSAFAFLAVAITLRQQQHALKLQHHELELTRKELKDSADAQQEMAKHQNNALILQAITPIIQEFDSPNMTKANMLLKEVGRKYGTARMHIFAEKYADIKNKLNSDYYHFSQDNLLIGPYKYFDIESSIHIYKCNIKKIYDLHNMYIISTDIARLVINEDHAMVFDTIIRNIENYSTTPYDMKIFDFILHLHE